MSTQLSPALTALLAANPALRLKEEIHESPIFGRVLLRELTRRAYREEFNKSYSPDDPTKVLIEPWYARIVARSMLTESGEQIFTDHEQLLDLPNAEAVWNEIFAVAEKILALSEVASDDLKSESAPTDS